MKTKLHYVMQLHRQTAEAYGKPFAVVEKDTQKIVSTHDTAEEAEAQMVVRTTASYARKPRREGGIVHHWHPSQNRRALEAFIAYAEARVDFAPLDKTSARLTLAWLRAMLTPPKT